MNAKFKKELRNLKLKNEVETFNPWKARRKFRENPADFLEEIRMKRIACGNATTIMTEEKKFWQMLTQRHFRILCRK